MRLLPVARRVAWLVAAIECIAVLMLALPAPSSAAARCAGAWRVVAGRSVCLRVGQTCHRDERANYLAVAFDCVRAGRRDVLRRASLRALRRGRVLELPASGRPTFRRALWWFSAAVRRLPGVRVPAGAVGADRYGTGAIKSLELYAPRLSPAQGQILRAVLTPHAGLTVDPRTLAVDARARPAKSSVLTALAPILLEAIKRLEAHGVVFKHSITLDLTSSGASGDLAYTVATWLDRLGSVCAITFTPSGVALDVFGRRSVMLHELMHCAAAEQSANKFAWDVQPKYLDEGLPEWASARVSIEWQGRLGVKDETWDAYLTYPEVNVRERSYDALGWWSLIEHLGVDLWKLQPAMVRAGGFGDSTRPYALAVSSSPRTLATDWGPTLAQSAVLGPRWNLDGPGMTRRTEPTAVVADGGEFAHGVDAGGGYESALDIRADVITIRSQHTVEGFLRDGAGTDRPIPNRETYCARPGGCQCPGDRDLPYPPITPGAGKIGFADPVETGAVVIIGRSLDEACPKPKNDACRVLAQAGVAGIVGTPGIFQFVVDRPLPSGAHFWGCIYIGQKPDPEDPTREISTGKAAGLNLATYPRTKRSTLLRNVGEFLRRGGYQLIHVDGAELAGIVRGADAGAAIQMLIGNNTALVSGGGGESDTRQLAAQVARVLR